MKGVTYRIIGGDGREYGPATLDEIRDWITDGRVGPSTRVWESDDGRWLPAAERAQLSWDLPALATPPVIPAAGGESAGASPTAPVVLRASAFLFDAVVVYLLVWLVSLPWEGQINDLNKAALESLSKPTPDFALLARFYAVVLGFPLSLCLAFHVGFNTVYGGTPGKLLVGIRIRRADGSRLTFLRALARFAAEGLSLVPLGAGYLVALFSPSQQALHDLVAGTVVVRADAA